MDPAASGADMGGDLFQESEHVVFGSGFVFLHLAKVELSSTPDRTGVLTGNDPTVSHGLAGQNFNFQPAGKFGLLRPK